MEKDGAWMTRYPTPDRTIAFGQVGVRGGGTDLAIVSYGNGIYLCCQAMARLEKMGLRVRVIDMRWLSPLPEDALVSAVAKCDQILIVDECRRSGGVAEGLMALFVERCPQPVTRLTAADSFIATGPAYAATLPSTDNIVAVAKVLLNGHV